MPQLLRSPSIIVRRAIAPGMTLSGEFPLSENIQLSVFTAAHIQAAIPTTPMAISNRPARRKYGKRRCTAATATPR